MVVVLCHLLTASGNISCYTFVLFACSFREHFMLFLCVCVICLQFQRMLHAVLCDFLAVSKNVSCVVESFACISKNISCCVVE